MNEWSNFTNHSNRTGGIQYTSAGSQLIAHVEIIGSTTTPKPKRPSSFTKDPDLALGTSVFTFLPLT